jgi:hypothetical protein
MSCQEEELMKSTLLDKLNMPTAPELSLEDNVVAPPDAGSALLYSTGLEDIESLLTDAGHAIEPLKDRERGFMARSGNVTYSAVLVSPSPEWPERFGGIQLSAFAPVPESLSLAVAARLALDLPGARLGIDQDGDLALMQTIVVTGGVTRANVGIQFGFWLQNLERVRQAVVRHYATGPSVVLH